VKVKKIVIGVLLAIIGLPVLLVLVVVASVAILEWNRLAESQGSRIAAVGLVAAAQPMDWSWCTDLRPVPVIAFHGAADPIVPYQGGPLGDPFNEGDVSPRSGLGGGLGSTKPVRNETRRIRGRSGCLSYRIHACAGDATVVLYTIQGGGHSWPGGKPLPQWWVGPTSRSIDPPARCGRSFVSTSF
jgi:polyhydroxybutyrate depolymerase